ncbi:hypothetical protein [Costertonia aggregata]|uniref:Uncharacterized protein n=1 Tax=Costertonia aggregata TaxID=343403 RepID=A0A7H9ASX7_9FLAO|nr:hypothetical protein [Costertonia aggregata]QLG46573.1 hypothetical protein HYG79_14860 [Costertonia aggregata]
MDEDRINRKPNWLPWIVIPLIVFASLIYFMFNSDRISVIDETPNISTEEVEPISIQEDFTDSEYTKADLEVTKYTSFIGNKDKLGTDFDYTKDALVQLSNAVRQAATEHHLNMEETLETIKFDAEKAQRNPDTLQLATNIKNVGKDVAMILKQLQQEDFPSLEHHVAKTNAALESIQPEIPIEKQKERLQNFFDVCGDFLKEMELNTDHNEN